MGYISGPFTATWKPAGGSATTIGGSEEGFEINESILTQEIKNDEYGDVPVDTVNLGIRTTVRLSWIDYEGIEPALYSTNTRGDPKAKVGHLGTASAGELVITPVAGSPAAAIATSYTFYKCVPEGDFSILLGSRHRKGPITFLCLPSAANQNKTYAVVEPS